MKRLAMWNVIVVVFAGATGVGVVGCGASKDRVPVAIAQNGQQPQDAPLLERLRQNRQMQSELRQTGKNADAGVPANEAVAVPRQAPAPTAGVPGNLASSVPADAKTDEAEGVATRGRAVLPESIVESLEEQGRLNRDASRQGSMNLGGAIGRGGGRLGRGGGGGGGRAAPARGLARSPTRIIWPTSNEEVWIIVRPQRPQVAMAEPAQEDFPRTGALLARLPDRPTEVAVPLKHTDVKASISGYIATVDVTQEFQNPFSTKIEAVYVFPLPHNAAINEFLMTVGERKIRGIIRERQEAEQIYAQARAQGYVASLLTQERPNIFTQKVANIEPSKRIDINIKYYHTLEYVDGWYEWHFPMVVGPRFNPSGWTDGVGAVPVGGQESSGQPTEVQYLRPEQRNGHDISLAVQVNAGVPIEQIESPNHRVSNSTRGNERSTAMVQLSPSDSIPNKDFVLRYKVAGQTLKSAIMVQRDPRGGGGYFTLMLVPPETMKNLPRQPLEMVFTLDVSGSMSGKPFEQARSAIEYALTHMNPQDTFQVIRFASGTEMMTPQAVPATSENVRAALAYVQQMTSGGGTNMLEGIRASLQFPHDQERTRYVAFLTDGYIGNEMQILREVRNSLTDSRIFSFGVGSSVNRYLLDHMAKLGAGAVTYLGLNDDAKEIMAAYFERISHPALSDIAVDYGGIQVSDVFPAKVPDLFVGRPVILTGRFIGRGQTTVRVTGRLGRETRSFDIPVNLDDSGSQHAGITSVWARMKIAALADQSAWDDSRDLTPVVRQVAMDHGLMSQFTAFVAVDSSTRTTGDSGTAVAVPVPMPEGVRYETTVPEGVPIVQPRPVVPRE